MNSIDLEKVLQKKQQLKNPGMALHADKFFDEDLIFEMYQNITNILKAVGKKYLKKLEFRN